MLPEQQQRILGYFIEEAKEHLATIEQGLLNLQSTMKDPEMLNEVFRAAHSIKGGAAMLGMSSIQRTAHRLEDCFKVLKECPVQIDQKLESLFLGVSDTLKALLENLTGPFGLTEETANHLMSEAEPVFGWLNEHLDFLVKQGATQVAPSDTDQWQQCQNLVLLKLREMLQLFKQQATPETRQSLQECCRELVELGEQINCSAWCNLCQAAADAIANQENSYLTLAKIVITDIKQALELVLIGRETEIVISERLEALIPLKIELLDITNDFVEQTEVETISSITTEESLFTPAFEATSVEETITSTTDDFVELATQPDLIDVQPEDSITNLSEISEQFSSHINDFDQLTAEPEKRDFDADDSIKNISEVSEQFVHDTDNFADFIAEPKPILSELSDQFNIEDEEEDLCINDLELNGPEVGIAELSTLAQLFESETPDFSESWDIEEKIIKPTPIHNEVEIDSENRITQDISNDFAEFLDIDTSINETQTINIKEPLTLVQLFGDDFVETENLELNDFKDLIDINENNLNNQQLLSIKNTAELEVSTAQENNISEFGNLFYTSSSTIAELSDFGDDLNLWTQVNAEKLELEFSGEQDAAKALEEILFAAAAADDMFSGRQKSTYPLVADLELEDLDIPQELVFSVDDSDDLFAELTADNSSISSAVGFSQEPEILELAPEFTNFSTEIQSLDLPQTADEQAMDWLAAIILEENSNDHLEVLFDSLPASNTNDVHVEVIDDHYFDLSEQNSIDDLFSIADPVDINFIDTSESQTLQTDADSELIVTSENIEINTPFDNINLFNKNSLIENHKIEEDKQEDEPNSSELAILNLELDEHTEITPNSIEEIEAVTEPAPEIKDTFAELDDLLNQELASDTNPPNIPEIEFAALEELLTLDQHENVVVTNQPTPTYSRKDPSNTVSSPEIENEFKELEAMVGVGVTPTTVNLPSSRNTGWNAYRFEQLMKVPVKHLDDLSNLVGELVVNRNTLEQDQERLRQSLDNLLHQVQQLSDVGARMQELYERSLLEASLLASRKNSNFGHSDTDRGFSELEMDRFTPFHSLSQEMIELIVRVRESASDIDFVTEETERVARQFRQVTGQLQEGLTRSRMEAFSQATELLPRGVRDNSIKYGKQVELVIQGGNTLIDKMILEHLNTPLTHLLNNAIAHGIETPEERQSKGKSPVGTITICAFHQGNQTVISVSDDGAGINSDAVKTKAMRVGLVTPTEAKTMSSVDVYDLLFQPGFSTKDQADDLAGRGVGLDVVRTKISEIRGTISIDSTLDKGTTFTIRLPLTLSICKALCCVSDKARIAFPMDGVEDTLDVPVKNVQLGQEGEKLIPWRDRMLAFKPLKELLTFNRQLSRGNVYGGNRDDDMISVVVLRSANTLVALQVDQVLSEQEIVIKQFEGPAPKPIGVAGATVLGDGRIMPIADVLEIVDIFQGRTSKQNTVSILSQKQTPSYLDTAATKIDPTVLIVDDSITVRELLSLTFNKAGYRVEQARDGQEAWDKLRSGLPCDLVFCDIEMPRCDGLELLSRIQKDPNLNHLPIAMLTSRGADKHRQMAISLGASGYFTKPYLEESLLEAATRMLKGEKLVAS